MKQIYNYILEKLHISKNYKVEDEITGRGKFFSYIRRQGFEIDYDSGPGIDNEWCKIYIKEKEYPFIELKIYDDYFTDRDKWGDDIQCVFNSNNHKEVIDKRDLVREPGKPEYYSYKYCWYNADLIIKKLNKLNR